MSKKHQTTPPAPGHPPLGTFIDGNALELVEILGIGGYGVVYRAVEAHTNYPRSFAVKCLAKGLGHSSSRRHMHMREITLHQIASAHPGVVTLHRVVEELDYTFFIMDYAPDHDLFTQILHERRYLGNDDLIRHIFLQLIDAVQYCHSLGIYHRDLKPENVLCFDEGLRIAITDFGLATTDKMSREFRTGSVYHMSPECQAADSVSGAPYSPMYNDIWSLGIILLNLTTGRNPWKSATEDDPTYQAYRHNPARFLPSVLPISDQLNSVLICALSVDWRRRLTLSEFRDAVEAITTFYSHDVVFDDNLATCPWEVGMDLGGRKQKARQEKHAVPIPEPVEDYCVHSCAPEVYEEPYGLNDEEPEDEDVAWDGQHSEYEMCPDYAGDVRRPYDPSGRSFSSDPESPVTPVDDFREVGKVHHVWDQYRVAGGEEESIRYHNQHSPAHFPTSFAESATDDKSSYAASSVFIATPVPPSKVYQEFQSDTRYPSPTTSTYSIAATSLHDPVNEVHQEQYKHRGSVDIPRKPKPLVFNPMRFFPRSSGTSWLNPKTLYHVDQSRFETHARQVDRRTKHQAHVSWDAHMYMPAPHPGAEAGGASNRHHQRASGGSHVWNRDWMSGFFTSMTGG